MLNGQRFGKIAPQKAPQNVRIWDPFDCVPITVVEYKWCRLMGHGSAFRIFPLPKDTGG